MLLPELQVSIEEELQLRHAALLGERERAVGIVGRLRPSTVEGVTAVYKQQCEDFHVHEIDLDGNVLHLSAVTVKSEVKREIREQKEIDVGRDMLALETEFLISAKTRESLRQAFSDADIDCLQRFIELLRHTHRHNQRLVDQTYEECKPESEAHLKKGVISYLVEIVPDRARKLEAEVSADFSALISYPKPPSLFLEGDSGVVRESCSPDANVRKLTRTRMHALIREHFPFLTSDVFEISEAQKLQTESGMNCVVGSNDYVFSDSDDAERGLSRFFWPGSSLEGSVTKTWVDELGEAALLFRVQPKPICVSQVFPHLVLRKLLDGGSFVEASEVKEKRLNSHKERWPKDRPPYLQFRLWKMNRDTAEAIQGVADACHINKKQFSWAGTKDRRGITVQNVRAYKTSAEHLKRATVAPSWDNNVFVSDFEYVEEPLRLGALQGNHFKVCLRNVEGSGLADAVASLQSRGFINFFGLQRFGTHRVGTHHVGAALLREDWQAAVRLIMGDLSLLGASTDEIATPVESPSPSAGDVELNICEDTEGSCQLVEQLEEDSRKRPSEPMNRPAKRLKASEIYLQQGDSVAAAQACPRYFHVEHAVLTHLAKEPKGFLPALLQMPRNSLALYIHAAQAVVWNMVASQRMAIHGAEVCEGDFTLPKVQNEQFKQVHVITAEEVATFTIEDVVLPVVGTMVEYPTYLKSVYDEACQLRLGLSLEQFMRLDINRFQVPGVVGDYRRLVVKPMDLSWEFIEAAKVNGDAPLLLSDVDIHFKKALISKENQVKEDEPLKDVNELVEDVNEDEPLTEDVTGDEPEALKPATLPAALLHCSLPKSSYLTRTLMARATEFELVEAEEAAVEAEVEEEVEEAEEAEVVEVAEEAEEAEEAEVADDDDTYYNSVMASSLAVCDLKGKLIISRVYRDIEDVNMEPFLRRVVLCKSDQVANPLFCEDNVTYGWLRHQDVFFVVATQRNADAMMLMVFLSHLVSLLEAYYKTTVSEESIKDNFVITHGLLDEILDFGYPQTTDPKILREYIKADNGLLPTVLTGHKQPSVPSAVTNAVSWRSDGVQHKKNEVFLDIVESVSVIISKNGDIMFHEVNGRLAMKSFLSGMPELRLGLNDKGSEESSGTLTIGKSVDLEDVKFHQCVRLRDFYNDGAIVFVPPDGEFELMSYRVRSKTTEQKPMIMVETEVSEVSSTRVNFSVQANSSFASRSVASNVEILVPVPHDVDSPSFRAEVGSVKYAPDKQQMIWTIKRFQGQKEYHLFATFGLPSVSDATRDNFFSRSVRVNFEIPYLTVSGILVKYLKIIEKSCYQALPWVRYITQSGDYSVRMR